MTLFEFALANAEATATFLSVLAAIFVGFLGYLANNARHKREYTLSVISPLLTNDRLFKTHLAVLDHHINGTKPEYREMSDAQREDVLQLLGYYEFLAASFLRKDLDRKTVLRHRRTTLRYTWEVLHPFIEARRTLLDSDRMYCEFDAFVRGYCK